MTELKVDPSRLPLGEVHVWWRGTETVSAVEISRAIAILSSNERARLEKLVFAPDRRDYALAHALLRRTLARYVEALPGELEFRNAPSGKPFLVCHSPGPPITFSLSHTRGLVACAVASGADVGVDVERIDIAQDCNILTNVFSDSEIAYLELA